MITEWTIRRIAPLDHSGTASWQILEMGPHGTYAACSANHLNRLCEDFTDLVLTEFGQIEKELTT